VTGPANGTAGAGSAGDGPAGNAPAGNGPAASGPPARASAGRQAGRLLVAVPLRVERAALGGRLPGAFLVGRGTRRAAFAAVAIGSKLDRGGYAGLLVTGTCGGLTDELAPGDLVVASEVRGAAVVRCADPGPLADALRQTGRSVHIGPIHTAAHLVDGAERAALAATGAIAVDTESVLLAVMAGSRPVLVVRAVSDSPRHPLRSVGIVRNGLSALRSLRAAAPVLADWSVAPSTDEPRAEEEVG
jgi:4-hydroxy-3-methylbut-2-en-1-yl diphosphate reductase